MSNISREIYNRMNQSHIFNSVLPDKKISNIRKLNMPNFSLSRIYKKENEKKISLVINNNIFNN